VRLLLAARHGESEFSARRLANGDPGVACPLTEAGRAQARALGEALAGEAIDLCAVTEFERVRETAELALAGRDVPSLVVPELNDPRVGEFEGRPTAEYGEWIWPRGPFEAPPGGEHRAELAARYARGLRLLLERPEATILHVGHAHPLAYLRDAVAGRTPSSRIGAMPYADVVRLSHEELSAAVELLEAWATAPAF
jgi:2,3-bisphosphoglycerate-dependent phosphoglycerate mutase